jgi:Leucine-rich repeat (LRR) protein
MSSIPGGDPKVKQVDADLIQGLKEDSNDTTKEATSCAAKKIFNAAGGEKQQGAKKFYRSNDSEDEEVEKSASVTKKVRFSDKDQVHSIPSREPVSRLSDEEIIERLNQGDNISSVGFQTVADIASFFKRCGDKIATLSLRLKENANLGTVKKIFSVCPNIKTLFIKDANLQAKDVVEIITPLRNTIEHLDFSGNIIERIPEELYKFTNLQTLNLYGNQITEIPEGIFALCKLENLLLTNNRIREIPRFIGNFTSIVNLYLDGNEIAEVPVEIGALKNLKFLCIMNNPFSNIFEIKQKLSTLLPDCEICYHEDDSA